MKMMKSSLPHLGEVSLYGAGYIDLAVLWRKLVQKHQIVFPYTGEQQASDVIQSGLTLPPTFKSIFFPPSSALKVEATFLCIIEINLSNYTECSNYNITYFLIDNAHPKLDIPFDV
jgi:hypothetical protein